jgi:hypothetical protein
MAHPLVRTGAIAAGFPGRLLSALHRHRTLLPIIPLMRTMWWNMPSVSGGDLDPHWYKYGPLYSYLLGIIYWILSWFHPIHSFYSHYFIDGSTFYYTARLVNSLLNIVLAILTFASCRNSSKPTLPDGARSGIFRFLTALPALPFA